MSAPGASGNARLADLEAEARYARERYQLYRAKAYGPRLTSSARLGELERQSKLATSRLEQARSENAQSETVLSGAPPLATQHAAPKPA